jgi:hypothetical protein
MFGIAAGGDIQNLSAATLERELDVLDEVGARWLRIDINWAQIQAQGPNSYNWGPIDRVVREAQERGIEVLGVIVWTPGWARPSGAQASYGPDPDQYAAFAATAVEHYSALGVHAYEVWNEPNIQAFWTPKPNAAHYTRLLKAAYTAIKGADPNATVLTGGTAPATTDGTNVAPVEWLRRIYQNGGGRSFDAVSHHPYSWPAQPGAAESWSAWHQMNGTSPSLRSVMRDNGDGAKKIWATEYGAPTDGPSGSHVSESTQAQMIKKAYELWSGYDWGGPLFAYEGRDYGTDRSTRENFFGLVRHDFSPKPAYHAYREAAEAAGGGSTEPGGEAAAGEVTATEIVVKGNGRGKVKGRIRLRGQGRSARMLFAVARAGARKVQLRLQRRLGGTWRTVSPVRRARVNGKGKFHRRLRSFKRRWPRPGRYRIRAYFPGSELARPATTVSRAFKVRPR